MVWGWTVIMNRWLDWTSPSELIIMNVWTIRSDVGERGWGDEAHSERAREVVVLAAALVAEVKRVLLLPLVWVAEQDHLTQEGVHDHVLVVDLFAARGGKAEIQQSKSGKQEKRREKRQKAISSHKSEKHRRNTQGTEETPRCTEKNKWRVRKSADVKEFLSVE